MLVGGQGAVGGSGFDGGFGGWVLHFDSVTQFAIFSTTIGDMRHRMMYGLQSRLFAKENNDGSQR